MDPLRQQRLDHVACIAVTIEAETGVPASAMVAQWALESNWGLTPAGHANYFGIKKAARHLQCCTITTHEVVKGQRVEKVLEFADYPSLEDSCRDYAWLISHGEPYAAVWAKYQLTKARLDLITGIARVYATDPNYAHLALTIATEGPVVQAIAGARYQANQTGNR